MSISCEVCYESYAEFPADRRPRALPLCGHDFCTRCIASLCTTERRPVCPKCRTPFFHDAETLMRKLTSIEGQPLQQDNHDNDASGDQNDGQHVSTTTSVASNPTGTDRSSQQQALLPSSPSKIDKLLPNHLANSYLEWPVLRCLLQLDERMDFIVPSSNNNNTIQSGMSPSMNLLQRALQAAPTIFLQIELDQRKKRELLDQLPTEVLKQEIENRRSTSLAAPQHHGAYSPSCFGSPLASPHIQSPHPFLMHQNCRALSSATSMDGSSSPGGWQGTRGRSTAVCCNGPSCSHRCQQRHSASVTRTQSASNLRAAVTAENQKQQQPYHSPSSATTASSNLHHSSQCPSCLHSLNSINLDQSPDNNSNANNGSVIHHHALSTPPTNYFPSYFTTALTPSPSAFHQYPVLFTSWPPGTTATTDIYPLFHPSYGSYHTHIGAPPERRKSEVFFGHLCTVCIFLWHIFIRCLRGMGSAIKSSFTYFTDIGREQRLQLLMIANAIPLLIGSFYVFHNPTFFVQFRTPGAHTS